MKRLSLILLCLCLTACSTQRYIAPLKCPEPVIYPEPDYPIKHLTEADKAHPGKVTQAYTVSLKQCMMQLNLYKTHLARIVFYINTVVIVKNLLN